MTRERRIVLLRLAGFAALLGTLVLAAALTGSVPSTDEVRDFGDDLGAAGPLLWIPLSALLSSVFFPGPALAGACGLLFGVPLGTAVALAGAVAAATLQMSITRHLARDQVGALLPRRVRRLDDLLERRGMLAVMYVRIVPGLPYVPMNYGAGLTKLPLRDMAAGTAVGALPKTFAYVSLGGSLDDLGRPEAIVAICLLVAMAIGGALAARRGLAAERSRA